MTRFELAKQLAQGAGTLAREAFGKKLEVRTKEDGSFVTEVDEQCERFIIDGIRRHASHDGIVAEESGHQKGSSGFTWYIDPIDGTTNFVAGIPIFATAIGIASQHMLDGGVIYMPSQGWLFAAARGKGATLNGAPIHVTDRDKIEDARLLISYPKRASSYAAKTIAAWPRSVRILGSAVSCWGLLAAGRTDVFMLFEQSGWDCAAGIALALEAGAAISTLDGKRIDHTVALPPESLFSFIASAPGIHAEALKIAQ